MQPKQLEGITKRKQRSQFLRAAAVMQVPSGLQTSLPPEGGNKGHPGHTAHQEVSFPLLRVVASLFVFLFKKVNLSESLNSNLEVNAGARSGLKGYGNLVFETYEKKVGGLVPQPPGWTSLHPHSISKLRKVHKNSRETWPRSTARPFSNIWTL